MCGFHIIIDAVYLRRDPRCVGQAALGQYREDGLFSGKTTVGMLVVRFGALSHRRAKH